MVPCVRLCSLKKVRTQVRLKRRREVVRRGGSGHLSWGHDLKPRAIALGTAEDGRKGYDLQREASCLFLLEAGQPCCWTLLPVMLGSMFNIVLDNAWLGSLVRKTWQFFCELPNSDGAWRQAIVLGCANLDSIGRDSDSWGRQERLAASLSRQTRVVSLALLPVRGRLSGRGTASIEPHPLGLVVHECERAWSSTQTWQIKDLGGLSRWRGGNVLFWICAWTPPVDRRARPRELCERDVSMLSDGFGLAPVLPGLPASAAVAAESELHSANARCAVRTAVDRRPQMMPLLAVSLPKTPSSRALLQTLVAERPSSRVKPRPRRLEPDPNEWPGPVPRSGVWRPTSQEEAFAVAARCVRVST